MRTLVQLISVSLLLGIVAAPSNAQLVVTLGDRPIGIDDGLTLDADGNLYGSSFINGTNGRIRIVTPQGIDSVFCTQLEGPLGHDFGPDGTLYVASYYQGTVSGVDANGDATVLVSGISRPSMGRTAISTSRSTASPTTTGPRSTESVSTDRSNSSPRILCSTDQSESTSTKPATSTWGASIVGTSPE